MFTTKLIEDVLEGSQDVSITIKPSVFPAKNTIPIAKMISSALSLAVKYIHKPVDAPSVHQSGNSHSIVSAQSITA